MRRSLALLALLLASVAAHATTLDFSFTTTASGSISPVDDSVHFAFSNVVFTITGSYDTASAASADGNLYAVGTSYSYMIGGVEYVGDTSFGGADLLQLNKSANEVYVGYDAETLNVETLTDPLFASNDLQHPFSVTVLAANTSTGADVVEDNMGVIHILRVDSNDSPVTFTLSDPNAGGGSTVTPEPSSLMLLSTGLIGMVGAARRRLRRA